ncbi:hypothetical protein T09_2101 [Trichinella sp. T9]|nr:hypothetical protein T09_2101 [Trichinella sp. T9]
MDYAKLNRRRNCLKGRMNRLCQDLDALIRQPESRIDVKMTLDSISKLLERCQEAQDAVEAVITNDDEIEKETQRWMDFEREIRSARGRAERYLEMNTEPVDSKKSSLNSALAKLPTWSILKFTGKVLDFSSFWEQFNAGIHDNAELADVTKFIYLRSLLEGEGLKAIDGYAVTQDNYPIARQALVSRFGNPKRVIKHHIQAIADLRPNGDRTLFELHDELVTHVRSLRALNRDTLGNQFAKIQAKSRRSLYSCTNMQKLKQEYIKTTTKDRNVREAEENCTPHGDERSEKSPETTPTDVSEPPNAVRVCGNRTKDTRDRTYLQTAKAYLYAPNGNYMKVMCLFDTGSQRSFMTKGIADSLGLTGLSERVCISTLGNNTCHKKLRRVSFSLKGITSNSQAKQINAYCVNRICDTLEENPPIMWEHTKDLNLADDFPRDRCDVDVLIGIDYYYHFLEDDRRRVVDEWLVALRSTLGWILCGQDSRTNYTDTVKVMRIDVEQRCDCGKHRRFGELEWITIMDQPETESPAERNYILLSCDDESTAQKIVCWSDSEVALSWIKSPAVKWKTFVRNRFESIQQLTEASVWCHCPTGENPAVMLSRGCSLKRLKESQLWWEGPPWLSLPITSSAEARNKITTLAVSVIEKNDRLDPSRFSNFEKLLRRHERKFAELTVEELTKAENFWLLTVQREAFEKELAAVQSGKNPEGKLDRFNPYLDENGLLRASGGDAAYQKGPKAITACRHGTDPDRLALAILGLERSLLIGNAAAAIEGLPLNVANYDAAMMILSDSFGRKEIIIEEHMKELQNLPTVTSQWDTNRLNQLANQLEVHVRGLEALQTPAEAYQAFLMPMILPRLPRELAVEWKRRRSERRDNVQELLAFLKAEILIRERHGSLDSSTKNGSEIKRPITEKKIYPGKKYTMAALHASIKQACNLCQQDHQIWNCSKFLQMDIVERQEMYKATL